MQNLYTENLKTLLRKIFLTLNALKIYYVCGLEDSLLLKCQLSPKVFINSIWFQSNSQKDFWEKLARWLYK